MKAVCVTESRAVGVREVATPESAPGGHLLVAMDASAINLGDKAFLARPASAGGLNTSLYDIWGASGVGTVIAMGLDVPEEFTGKSVALYRSLTPSPHTVGLWSERAVVPWTSAVILPNGVAAQDYCGSLVNAITAYAYLDEMVAAGHKGVVVTAGSSATGLAMAALARNRGVPGVFLVRSEASREELCARGVEHVLDTSGEGFEVEFARLAEQLQATAVFDGVGGGLITRIAPLLPTGSTVSFYGFLGGPAPVSVPSAVFMMKDLTMRRFSNFNSATVQDRKRLAEALGRLRGVMTDPLFRTKVGKVFGFEEIGEAMAYESGVGAKAILVVGV